MVTVTVGGGYSKSFQASPYEAANKRAFFVAHLTVDQGRRQLYATHLTDPGFREMESWSCDAFFFRDGFRDHKIHKMMLQNQTS